MPWAKCPIFTNKVWSITAASKCIHTVYGKEKNMHQSWQVILTLSRIYLNPQIPLLKGKDFTNCVYLTLYIYIHIFYIFPIHWTWDTTILLHTVLAFHRPSEENYLRWTVSTALPHEDCLPCKRQISGVTLNEWLKNIYKNKTPIIRWTEKNKKWKVNCEKLKT